LLEQQKCDISTPSFFNELNFPIWIFLSISKLKIEHGSLSSTLICCYSWKEYPNKKGEKKTRVQNLDLQENSISSPTTAKRQSTYRNAQKDSMVLPFSSSETAHATTPAHWSSTSAPPYYYYCCFCCLPHRSKHALASSLLDTAFCCHGVLLQILPISSHQPLLVAKMIMKTVILFLHLLSPSLSPTT
jgi:hypothetical protein